MNQLLTLLIKLQTVENLLEDMKKEKDDLPKLVKDIEKRLSLEKEELNKLQKREKDLEITRRAKEKYLIELGEKITDRKSKLFKVKTNEEYSALLKEIENLKKEVSDTEDEVIKILYETEECKKLIEQKEKELKELEKILNDKKLELNEKLNVLENKINELQKEKEDILNSLDEKTKSMYIKLKETKGKVIVPTIDKKCMGCFMAIPIQVYLEVKKGETLVTCPQCGRILYYEERVEESKDND